MGKTTIKIFAALIFLSVSIFAQSTAASAQGRASSGVRRDSLKEGFSREGLSKADSSSLPADNKVSSDTAYYVMHKSPWGAVLRSAVLPGWGQVYNQSYWKVPVVWGFIGFYTYYWIDQNKKYRNTINDYTGGNKWGWAPDIYVTRRNFYRDQRDLFAIYIGIVYALNMLDAYVDAHLFDFSVDEDPRTGASMLQLRYHF
ncbi:MAG: DUF5683 domain-containing protein [Bacteroidota bacterium]|nr:DUF5683 domain-containing protein [Bacteroidota bacterium]MDP4190913.1 DUF5683 domain-containing protein [Bacteroidota bacterium]MDP4193941.1 DUF5683 domain-containing protein [Bacteroidota bacterium]